MPLFFVNVRDGDILAKDPEGTEFADLDAARADVLVATREALGKATKYDRAQNSFHYEITDEAGQVVATFPLMDALKP